MTGLALLALTAASVGFVHTLMGPDHYLPFLVLARARGWSVRRTTLVTLACGLGHVLSSVLLGTVGIATGLAVSHLESVESQRASVAAWLLVTVGLVYCAWGLHRALRATGRHHFHFPSRDDLSHLDPLHSSPGDAPGHLPSPGSYRLTPWVLFVIFVLGPCEPLIPVLMFPAATGGWLDVAVVAAAFGVATLAAMLLVVGIGLAGLTVLPLHRLERYGHALAGAAIALTGLAVQLLGL